MLKKYLKVICIGTAMLLIAASLGACKKDNEQTAAGTTAKSRTATASKTSSTTTKKASSTSTTKTGSTTNKQDGTASSSGSNDISGNQDSSSGNQSGPSNEEQPSGGNEQVSNDFAPTEDAALDLGGRKILIKAIRNIPVEPTQEELALNPKAGIQWRYWKAAEQKLNFVAEWELVDTSGHVADYINATTAGMKYADLLYTQSKRVFPSLPAKNLLVPLDDYIDFSDPLLNNTYLKEVAGFGDKIYGMGMPSNTGYCVFYNKDIIDREGIEIFNTYVKTGNWTWETMMEVGRATTKDMNGDGVVDQWGMIINNPGQTMDMMLFSNGARYFEFRDGKYVFTANEPRAVRTLQYMSDLRNVHKIAEFDDTNGLSFISGNGAILLGKFLFEGKNYINLGMNIGFAPLPKGPDVTEYQNVEGNGDYFMSIPVNTDPKVAAAIIKEAMIYWDPSKPEYLTREDMVLSKLTPNIMYPEEIDWAMQYYVDPGVSLHKAFSSVRSYFDKNVSQKIYLQETTPAAALQEVEPPVTAIITDYMGY